jgi:hypothetical protein
MVMIVGSAVGRGLQPWQWVTTTPLDDSGGGRPQVACGETVGPQPLLMVAELVSQCITDLSALALCRPPPPPSPVIATLGVCAKGGGTCRAGGEGGDFRESPRQGQCRH